MRSSGLAQEQDLMLYALSRNLSNSKTFNDHITLKDVQDLMVCEPLNDVFKMVGAHF